VTGVIPAVSYAVTDNGGDDIESGEASDRQSNYCISRLPPVCAV
jgi:hypothetical protein